MPWRRRWAALSKAETSREELISKVLFLINVQAQRLVTVIQAVPRNVVNGGF